MLIIEHICKERKNKISLCYKVVNMGKDKIYHFIACLIITLMLPYGWIMAIGIGFGKEIYDKYIKKTLFDWYDILADAIGIILGIIIKTDL